MKYRLLVFFGLALLFACKDNPIPSSNRPVLPEMPSHWKEILGEPHWRLEWIDESGNWQSGDLYSGSEAPGLSLVQEWSNPVLAWPFWPEWNLLPGTMRPAGAIFPWDKATKQIILSWKGGVEAVFWKELAIAERASAAAYKRLPWYFDWPRFRELLESDNVSEAIREDPWLADWKEIARKTVLSGFDRRRISPRAFSNFSIPHLSGGWIGSSPFADPVDLSPDGPLVLSVTDVPDTWVSPQGILKCSKAGYVFTAR